VAEPASPAGPPGIDVECACGARFRVLKSLQSGLVNCPACHRIVPVKGGPEPLFWVCLGGGVLLVAAVAAVLFAFAGMTAGLIALGAGALVIGACVLCS